MSKKSINCLDNPKKPDKRDKPAKANSLVTANQRQRAKRRKAIAEYVNNGHTVAEASAKFEVSLQTIRDSCKIHGITLITGDLESTTYEIIASMILERGPLKYFAEKHRLSKQRIGQIKEKCVKAGIPLGVGHKLGYEYEPLTA